MTKQLPKHNDTGFADIKKQFNIKTDKQVKFVKEYHKSGNATEAYIKAGYKSNSAAAKVNAHRLLTYDNLQKYLKTLQTEVVKEYKIDRDMIINRTMEVLNRTTQQIAALDKEGNEIGVFMFDATNSLKALEFLAKMAGFLDKQEVDDKDRPTVNIVLKNYLQQNNQYVNQIIQEAKDRVK